MRSDLADEGAACARRTSIDRLYDRLIRDLFARVVPGMLILLAIAVSVTSFDEVTAALERASIWMWLLGFGAGWLTAFALVALGRRFNLVLVSPDPITDEQGWIAEERFRARASRRQRATYDRRVTAREATGTVSVSLFLAFGVLALDFVVDVHLHESPWNEVRNGAVASVVVVALGLAMQLAHREYVRRAWHYLESAAALGEAGQPTAN